MSSEVKCNEDSTEVVVKNSAYKVPSNKTLVWRLGLELLSIAVVGIMVLVPYLFRGYWFAKPQVRGFFCNDENIKHPFIAEAISIKACVLIWIAICLAIVPLVEILHFKVYEYKGWEDEVEKQMGVGVLKCFGKLPRVIFELYRIIGYFTMGFLFCLYTTEHAKYQIGRLRPYYLTVCNMELSPQICKDNGLDTGYNTFVLPDFQHACNSNEYKKAKTEPRIKQILDSKRLDKLPCCNVLDTSKNISRYHLEHIEHIKKDKGPEHILEEARKSFMSGHSSFSFYCATFLVIYLQVRLSNDQVQDCKLRKEGNIVARTLLRGIKILRPFIQFMVYALAFWVALTRISDYRHHPFDVVTGTIFGNIFAIFILYFHVDIFRRTRSFRDVNCKT